MSRTTRSKKVFSPWDLEPVNIANPQFNFKQLLLDRIHCESSRPDEPKEDDAAEDDAAEDNATSQSQDREGEGVGEASNGPLPEPTPSSKPVPPHDQTQQDPSKTTPHQEPPCETPQSNPRKRKRNAASHAARAKKRACTDFAEIKPRKSVRERYSGEGSEVVSAECSTTLDDQNVTSTAFVGLRDSDGGRKVHPLEYFCGKNLVSGFKLEHWDGFKPKALVDKNNRVIGILAGHPNTDDWNDVRREAQVAIEDCRKQCQARNHSAGRRGPFTSLRCGVSHGGGQKAPTNLHNDPETAAALNTLNGMEFFKRVSKFSNSVFATRLPDLYAYYVDTMERLYQHDPTLRCPFGKCVYAACTLNLGPQTCCYKHRDFGNLAFGVCSITSLGEYDSERGGHLVLWDYHMVVEFPPGSTILIPSAIVAHSNTAIQPGESRYSFAQYTSGALFRWVENGFQKATTYQQSLSKEGLEKLQQADSERWEFGLSLLPILSKSEK